MSAAAAPVEFYRASERPFGAFSNLFRREISIAGRTFATSEHAYQALKPRDARVRDWLLAAPTPALLAIAAHTILSEPADPIEIMSRTADALLGYHTRPGWSRLRYPWMLRCLDAKFDQHDDLAELLLSTDESMIMEAGRIDDDAGRRWGIVNGRGSNYLGRMLQRVRHRLGGPAVEDPDLDERLAAGIGSLAAALEELGWT